MKLEFRKVIKEATLCKIREIIEGYNPPACFEGLYYVAVKDGWIVGCVSLVERGWYMTEIKHLFVKKEDRECGIGKFLLEEALRKVKTPLVCCTVRSDNERSIRLFSGRSFEKLSSFRNAMTGHDILLMVKKLES